MHDALIYMVTYEGQWDGMKGESPYKWTAFDRNSADKLKSELEEKDPERQWSVSEKDVS
jgi:hypothetical protein